MSREILSKYSDEAFAKIVAENTSILQIGIALGYSSTLGAGFNKIKKRIEDLGLSTEHFTSQSRTKWTKDTAFVKGTIISSRKLRSLYNQYSGKPYICSICGQKPKWNGQPLTLILDHINGDHFDNRIDNLRWVCPNCNQQLDTTGSKNKTKREKIQNHCVDCGKVISKNRSYTRTLYRASPVNSLLALALQWTPRPFSLGTPALHFTIRSSLWR